MEERRREGKKGRNDSLCVWFLRRLEYSAPSQCRTHGYRDRIYRAVVSFYAVPNFPYFSKGIFPFVDREMRLFVFSNGFASEIFLFVQLINRLCYQIVVSVTVGYDTLITRSNER